MTQATPESFEQKVLSRFDAIDNRLTTIDVDIKATNAKVEKWDGRLWGLTLALIGTAWAGIIGASVVVITRSLSGV
ncbi:hypothetical protein C1752_17190 [Acaryochloris thomasi RCC1774]|uniref:Uncharacterized protein n=1 Tax=Acaryochloris thomasi RCC1774 TaxID=1764569 RepID=A0A2W1JEK2_9CYAN|nr:hypothetical protein [Acaryochloris thomasi]PZD70175.1 hypothetical protein C1752_17190 [Acaryochloris thomasi RCC1774]